MNGNHAELARRLTTLSQRFVRMSAELAEAGRGLLDRRVLPAEALAEELAAVQADFEDLRGKVVAAAAALAGGAPPPVTTLRELEVLVRAITDRESARARRQAEEEAGDTQRRATEESRRRAAEEAKQRAEAEARHKAEEEARHKGEAEAKRRAEEEAKRKGAEEAKRRAEEEARRRVAVEAQAQAQARAEAEARRKADEEAKRRGDEEARRRADEAVREQAEARRRAEADAKHRAEEEARRKTEEEAARHEAEEIARRQAEEDARRRAEEPEPEPVAAAEDEGQDLGLETAQWWISASASWASMKSKRTAFAAAVHDVLAKYPYVFSVPIQSSADYEDGLLAYGYAVLLDHVEQRRPGFVEGALNHLPVRQGASLGRRLYDYLAAALRESYLEFVKTLMLAALPRSPLWVTGGLEDSDAATSVFTRPTAKIGDPNQKTERSTQDAQRFADRQFTVEVAPLTTRFFRVEATEVREPRVVDIRLAEKSAPSDQAWLVMIPRTGAAQARRHERQGSMVAGIGKDYTAVWIAIFNTDAEAEKRFELTVGVRKRGVSASFRKPR